MNKQLKGLCKTMNDITPTDEQNEAIHNFFDWFKSFKLGYSNRSFNIFGPAGSGKTSICKVIIQELQDLNKKVCCCSFTGKAARNFTEKTGFDCNTIHSTIYKPVIYQGKVVDWRLNFNDSAILDSDLILIDEISMVYQDLWNDLLKYNKPILVFGDPYQLPPVNNELLFTIDKCDFLLKHIHRQALDNPIIRLSMLVREGKEVPYGNFDNKVIKMRRDEFDMNLLTKFDQVLCGKNDTRMELNQFMRNLLNFEGQLPRKGEKLICLRNNREAAVFNGMILNTLTDVITVDNKRGTFDINLDFDDGYTNRFTIFDDEFIRKEVREDRWKILKKNPWFCQFYYSYAVTAHKSQGSEWNSICLFDESWCFREDRKKWEYTGITRAKEKLLILK